MGYDEFLEWQVYDTLAPFGDERADLRAGVVAATMANAWRGKNQRAFAPADFLLRFEPERPSQDVLMAKAMRITAAQGGKVRKR